MPEPSFLNKVHLRLLWLSVGGPRHVPLGSEGIDQIFIDVSPVLHFPDLAVAHDIDDLQLADQVVDEELDRLNAEVVFELLDIGSLIHDFHEVLGAFLVVDPVDAGFGESLGELLHDVVASLHDLGPRERLHLQEGVPCVESALPELILIFGIKTSYFDLS